jgi:hypothetical protein
MNAQSTMRCDRHVVAFGSTIRRPEGHDLLHC